MLDDNIIQADLIDDDLDDDAPLASFASMAEQVLRNGLEAVRNALVDLRAQRDQINGDVRGLVADEEVLVAALRPFDRRAAAPSPNGDE